jgi:glutamine amidotransferase
LGICLGMQMLLDFSEEFGVTQGLGLIPGAVTSIPETSATGEHLKVPHIGWAGLVAASGSWDDSILKGIAQEVSMYFVHSYVANPYLAAHRIADCLYGGHVLAAVIACDNVMGCQFHPEKSGEAGLGVLRNFLTR